MFSVIIPLYNKATHIEKCLNSVLSQSFTDFEIIVVNDGSTDEGEEVVRKVMAGHGFVVQGSEVQGSGFKVQSSGFSEDPEINNPEGERRKEKGEGRREKGEGRKEDMVVELFSRRLELVENTNSVKPETRNPNSESVIQHPEDYRINDPKPETRNPKPETRLTQISQPNSGVSTARNNGVKYAAYDYIAFLDADDWWEPGYLEKINDLISQFPQAAIYGSSYFINRGGKKQIAPIGVPANFEKGLIDYVSVYAQTLCMPLWTGAVVMRLRVFDEMNGFKSNLKLGEDFDLWIRTALKYPVAFINEPLSNYNQDVEAASRAVGRLHPPENHMLWNLDYLAEEEKQNNDLRVLLGKLRTYGLWPYYLSVKYHHEAKKELQKVAAENYSRQFRILYVLPLWAARLYWKFRLAGSALKKRIGKRN